VKVRRIPESPASDREKLQWLRLYAIRAARGCALFDSLGERFGGISYEHARRAPSQTTPMAFISYDERVTRRTLAGAASWMASELLNSI
jgi:hypothetical protein